MSASLALAGVGACTKQPPEAIVPYVRQPEDLVPGRPLFFASAIPFSGIANPVLVESHMTFFGTIGLFVTLFFLFIRALPMISIFEMRTIVPEAEVKGAKAH